MKVLGDGPVPCDIFVLGEAPGAEEDASGRPMVGAAGRKLNKLLERAGLRRSDVHVDNVIQFRPPNNRTPTKGEIKRAFPDLLRRIERVQPKVIIACGATAVKALRFDGKITQLHGRACDYDLEGYGAIKVVPMYHPAATLYDGRLIPVALSDWTQLPAELAGERTGELGQYRLATDDEAAAYVGDSLFAFDLETTSPRVGRSLAPTLADILGYSVAIRPGEALYVPSPPRALIPALESETQTTVCHNCKYEYVVLKRAGITLRGYEDTKLLAYCSGQPTTGLKELTSLLLGIRQTTFEEATGGRPPEELTPEEWVEYAAADSDLTLRLYWRLQDG